MTYEGLLNTEVAIYTRTLTTNELGEKIETWSFSESGVKCRLVPISALERRELVGEYQDIRYKAYFLSSQSLDVDDRIKYNGEYYSVKEVLLDSSGNVKTALLKIL